MNSRHDSYFETPIMRDISKLLLPICIGIIGAFALAWFIGQGFPILNASLEFEMEAHEKGFTWADKQMNGCFVKEDRSFCSSSSLPWEVMIWQIPLTIGLLVVSFYIRKNGEKIADRILDWIDRRQTKRLFKCQLEKVHEEHVNDGLTKCPDCGKQLVKNVS